MKPKVEKYFDGMVFFKEGIPHDYPEVINKEEQKRTLLQLYWTYQSKKAKKLKRIHVFMCTTKLQSYKR